MKREMTCSQQEKQDVNHATGGKSCWYRYSNSNQVSQHRVKIHVSKRHRILVEWRNKAVKSGKSRKTGKTQKNEPWKSNRGRKKPNLKKARKLSRSGIIPGPKKLILPHRKQRAYLILCVEGEAAWQAWVWSITRGWSLDGLLPEGFCWEVRG